MQKPPNPVVQTASLAAALALTLVCGCAIGPDYIRPSLPDPAAWPANQNSGAPQGLPASDRWWGIYKDPTLEQLISRTIANNQQIQVALERVIESKALARAALTPLLPAISFAPDFEWKEGRLLRSIDTRRRGNLNDLSFPLELNYQIDIWGRTRRRYESLRAQAEADAQNSRAVLLAFEAEVARNYFRLRSLDSELAILDRNIKLRDSAVSWTRARVKAGHASEVNVKKAQGELASTQAKRFDVERQRAQISGALALLLGQPASTFSLPAMPLDLQPPALPTKLKWELLERRPDIAQAERLLAARSAEIGVAKASYLPRFHLRGMIGYESATLNTLFDWDSRAGSINPSISLPLFDGGLNSANLKAARAAYDQALGNYRQKVLVAFSDIEAALAEIRSHDLAAERLNEATQASRAGVELSRIRMDQGQVSYFEVLDGQRTLLLNELIKQQNTRDRFLASVSLVEALGGGWTQATSPASINLK